MQLDFVTNESQLIFFSLLCWCNYRTANLFDWERHTSCMGLGLGPCETRCGWVGLFVELREMAGPPTHPDLEMEVAHVSDETQSCAKKTNLTSCFSQFASSLLCWCNYRTANLFDWERHTSCMPL